MYKGTCVLADVRTGPPCDCSELDARTRRTLDLPLALNGATADDLMLLPGIGPARAEAIVASRDEHGPFERIDDLGRVPGIGRKTTESLRPFLYVGTPPPCLLPLPESGRRQAKHSVQVALQTRT